MREREPAQMACGIERNAAIETASSSPDANETAASFSPQGRAVGVRCQRERARNVPEKNRRFSRAREFRFVDDDRSVLVFGGGAAVSRRRRGRGVATTGKLAFLL